MKKYVSLLIALLSFQGLVHAGDQWDKRADASEGYEPNFLAVAAEVPVREVLLLADGFMKAQGMDLDKFVVTSAEINQWGHPKPYWRVIYKNKKYRPPTESTPVISVCVFTDKTVDFEPGK